MISRIKKLEKEKIDYLNNLGWNLEPSLDDYDVYDAFGETPAGSKCWIEMKFRNDYWDSKMLEKKKYDSLMELEGIKFYYVNDNKAEYYFNLSDIKMPPVVQRYCPSTTLWNKRKERKEVYLLEESLALKIISH